MSTPLYSPYTTPHHHVYFLYFSLPYQMLPSLYIPNNSPKYHYNSNPLIIQIDITILISKPGQKTNIVSSSFFLQAAKPTRRFTSFCAGRIVQIPNRYRSHLASHNFTLPLQFSLISHPMTSYRRYIFAIYKSRSPNTPPLTKRFAIYPSPFPLTNSLLKLSKWPPSIL